MSIRRKTIEKKMVIRRNCIRQNTLSKRVLNKISCTLNTVHNKCLFNEKNPVSCIDIYITAHQISQPFHPTESFPFVEWCQSVQMSNPVAFTSLTDRIWPPYIMFKHDSGSNDLHITMVIHSVISARTGV